jgi:phage repressor protein C with HTH and peptisase S24 domain
MLTHKQIWTAIDQLAARYGLSPSGLARKAGLDATTFNPSKRTADDGKKRWPSTESVSKCLAATGASLDEFISLVHPKGKHPANAARAVPLIGLAEAGSHGFYDDSGFPAGSGWDHVRLPSFDEDGAYALQVKGDSMLPLYRDGDIIILSPGTAVSKGDRVVVKTRKGEVMAKVLNKKSARKIELGSINPAYPPRVFDSSEVDWMARIVWAKQ